MGAAGAAGIELLFAREGRRGCGRGGLSWKSRRRRRRREDEEEEEEEEEEVQEESEKFTG